MTDLRQNVEADRGLIKKIELAIPGFKGYREREDLRIADSLLRKHLADKLNGVLAEAEASRKELSSNLEMDLLDVMASVVSGLTSTEARVRHAEQGYSGVSPDFRVEQEELNRMYEWDARLLDGIAALKEKVGHLRGSTSSGDHAVIRSNIDEVRAEIEGFNRVLDDRLDAFAGLGVER